MLKRILRQVLLRACCLLAAGMLCVPMAQSRVVGEVDSLLNVYAKASLSQKHVIGRQLFEIFHANHVFMDAVPPLSTSMKEDSLNFMVWYGSERFFFVHSYFRESLLYANKALSLAESNDLLIYATLLVDQGYTLYKNGLLSVAAEAAEKSVSLCQRINEKLQLSRAYLYLALINYRLRQLDDARFFLQKALKATDKLETPYDLQQTYDVASEIYFELGELSEAGRYAKKAIDLLRASKQYSFLPIHLVNLSKVQLKKHEHQAALKTADEALESARRYPLPDHSVLAECLMQKAQCLMSMNQYADAVAIIEDAISYNRKVENRRALCQNYKALYQALLPLDTARAIDALEIYTEMFDSIHEDDLNNRVIMVNAHLANNELQHENEMKSRANALLVFGMVILIFTVLGLIQIVYTNRRENNSQRDRILQLLRQLEKLRTVNIPQTAVSDADVPEISEQREDSIDFEPETSEAVPEEVAEPLLTPYNAAFLAKVNDIILSQMRSGNIRIEHIASTLCLSPSQFRRKIQGITGLTPANYILTIRMDEAKRMLEMYPKYSVSEVALSCGFADNSHFTHSFTRLFGITPLQFANQVQPIA